MYFIFTNNKIMSERMGILASVGTAVALSTTPVTAAKIDTNKLNQVLCETKKSCKKLSLSIQSQINELEEKISQEKSPKKKFFLQRDISKLSDKLIALEKAETKYNNNLIAEENKKQEIEDNEHLKQKETIETQEQIKAQLTSIKGSL